MAEEATDRQVNTAKIIAGVFALLSVFGLGTAVNRQHTNHVLDGVEGCAPCTSYVRNVTAGQQKEIVDFVNMMRQEQLKIINYLAAKEKEAEEKVDASKPESTQDSGE